MRIYKFFFVSLIIILHGCINHELEDIVGVWVLNKKISNKDLNSSDDIFGSQYPIIFDIKRDGNLLVKNFSNPDTTFIYHWISKSDTVISIDSIDFIIHGINSDSLSLIDLTKSDSIWYIFRRPVEVEIKLNEKEISSILTSKIWYSEESKKFRHSGELEYFDNGIKILRYNLFDRNVQDSSDVLHIENWAIGKYRNYYFLYGFEDELHERGWWDYINQITAIDSTSFSIIEDNNITTRVSTFLAKDSFLDYSSSINYLKGKWISKNTNNKNYGSFLPESAIKEGRVELYKGNITLEIQDDRFVYQLDRGKSKEYKWKFGKHANTIVLEYKIENGLRENLYYECFDILKLSPTKMILRLYNNFVYSGQTQPRQYILKLIQEFEKIE